MITIEQLKDIKERTEALNRYLDIEGKKIQVEEEQLRTQAPGFWDDQKAAEAVVFAARNAERHCLLSAGDEGVCRADPRRRQRVFDQRAADQEADSRGRQAQCAGKTVSV